MRKLFIAALLAASATAAHAADFRLYPGFTDKDSFIEMTTDKGLVIEMVLRCSRKGNKIKAGIMTYSKVERLFCSSKNYCTRDALKASNDTCGY